MDIVAITTEDMTTADMLSASFGMLKAAWTKAIPVMNMTSGSVMDPEFVRKLTIDKPIIAMEANTPQNWYLKND